MSEMIERVARAIEWAPNTAQNLSPDEFRLHVARVTIEAMREPTREMVGIAGLIAVRAPNGEPALAREEGARGVWQTMIDAALKPKSRTPTNS